MGSRCRAWTLPADSFSMDRGAAWPAPTSLPTRRGFLTTTRRCLRRRFAPGYVGARKLSQIMPWHTYRGMTDEDIAAMFAYVKTFKPVHHHVDNTEPPTFCKVCRQTHGGGNQN